MTSSNTSTATSPTNTPASFAAAVAEPPSGSIPEVPTSPQPDAASPEAEEADDKENSVPETAETEPTVDTDLDSKNVEKQLSEDASVVAADCEPQSPRTDTGQPEISANATAESEAADNNQYNIDVKTAAATSRCDTEDLLDDLYIYTEENINHSEADVEEQPQRDAPEVQVVASTQNTTEDSTRVVEESTAHFSDSSVQEDKTGSLNLEDSEAVLLTSDLEDSIYRSVMNGLVTDEMHAIEKSQASESTEDSHENAADVVYSAISAASRSKASREYVVTPSAFATESEPSAIAYVNQESGAHAFDTEADAAEAVANIMSGEIYAAARAGDMEASARNVGDSSANDRQLSDSYVHVSQDLNSGLMSSRGGSEKAERAVSEAIDNTKSSAKDAANKASDKAKDASDKANRAAKDAADSTGEAANRAKDILDDASKSVKGAASRANTRAHNAIDNARESGGKFAKRAMDEASEAEKALEKQAKETSPAVLRTLGVVAAALAVVSGYYFRLPGRDNQRFGFAGGIASAIIGLGTLATAFVKNNK
ncbi:hypothetical protein COEREDRAFT_81967 [Coemansia reversa NRRL 1564]|uniref:Uncharacterized protein n=1 Tax=Coemansia reversa (strain ATCC 12441 / NRRL 1564) TaxID=763665 RepID=A0A2G5B8U4_COERN|nr:hypothetical protein COEREDRAFT_81967 [Coemansia reversa NRRL 1564]|eukprot:PIA15410.1 hypothetical protein COEREDRAFT_81967 [Coemansia reversa NRRL 1564]